MIVNVFKLTEDDNKLIAEKNSEEGHIFFSQDLEDYNKVDLIQWTENDELVGVVSEIHGGIIGYIHRDLADDLTTILNIHAINRQMTNE